MPNGSPPAPLPAQVVEPPSAGPVMAIAAHPDDIESWCAGTLARAAVLFTHDPEHPWPPYLAHRDHRAVGRAALDAVYPLARDRLTFPDLLEDGLQPHAVQSVWLFASDRADSYVDITAGLARKLAARLAHVSQTPDPENLTASWRRRAAQIGAPVGLPWAEAFTVLQIE